MAKAEITSTTVIRIVIPDEKYPKSPDVYDAIEETQFWHDDEIAFRVDGSTLIVTPSTAPYYIELLEAIRDYKKEN